MAEGRHGASGRHGSERRRAVEARHGAGNRHGHRHSEAHASPAPLLQLGALVFGAVLTAIAWVYLVRASIAFGVVAKNGQPAAWLFSLGAAIGAVGCLGLMLALVGRGLRSLGFISDYHPRRAGARRRH